MRYTVCHNVQLYGVVLKLELGSPVYKPRASLSVCGVSIKTPAFNRYKIGSYASSQSRSIRSSLIPPPWSLHMSRRCLTIVTHSRHESGTTTCAADLMPAFFARPAAIRHRAWLKRTRHAPQEPGWRKNGFSVCMR